MNYSSLQAFSALTCAMLLTLAGACGDEEGVGGEDGGTSDGGTGSGTAGGGDDGGGTASGGSGDTGGGGGGGTGGDGSTSTATGTSTGGTGTNTRPGTGTNTQVACMSYEDEQTCEDAGCSWFPQGGGSCIDPTGDCSQAGETICDDIPGCTWDTESEECVAS